MQPMKGKLVMHPQLLKEAIKSLKTINRPLRIEGPPGCGKTTVCREVAGELGIGYVEVHMPTMLLEDFGIPMFEGKTLEYKMPWWYPAADDPEVPEFGILCFDDRGQASADLQKVMANIIDARNLHGRAIKPGWMVLSTANRVKDRAGAGRTLSHLSNRETIVQFDVSADDWREWAAGTGNVHPDVLAFIKINPTALMPEFNPLVDANATPRSWVKGVSQVLDICPPRALTEVLTGAIGEALAREFVGFRELKDKLPTLDDVIADPVNTVIPEPNDHMYVVCSYLAYNACAENIDALMTYINRFPKREFQGLVLRWISLYWKESHSSQAIRDWHTNPNNHKLTQGV